MSSSQKDKQSSSSSTTSSSSSSSSSVQHQEENIQIKQEHRGAAEVVRAPLAVPMAHQGGSRSAGFAALPRLGSLRSTPDLSLGAPSGAPKPAFAPLIPNARSHSRKMAGEKIDQKLPGPIPSLLSGDSNKRGGGRGGSNATGQKSGRRSNAVFLSADEVGGFVPSGVRTGDHRGSGSNNSSALLRAAMKHDDDAVMDDSIMATGMDGAGEGVVEHEEPDFDPWDAKEPIQLPLVDPRDPASVTSSSTEKESEHQKEREELTALGMPRTANESMQRVPDPRKIPFHDSFGELLNDDQLFMIQLPSQLPYKPEDNDGNSDNNSGNASAEAAARARKAATAASFEKQHEFETPPFRGNLAGMEGYVGKLQVHKSGRVTLMLTNGVTFDVERGSDPKFLEELFVVSQPSQQCFRLGSVAQHVMVMPNTDSLGLTADTETNMLANMSLSSDDSTIQKPDPLHPASTSPL